MAFQVADWVIPLFFLAALAILAKYRRQIQSEDKESFKYISSGLVLLALVSVSRVLYMDGYFAETPFLSDPLFYRIASWIVIITGAAFIISGLATWLPIANRTRRQSSTRLARLEFLKRIENLATTESRPDRLFSTALEYMMEHHQLRIGIAFRYSAARNLLLENGFFPEGITSTLELKDLSINTTALQQMLAEGDLQPLHVFQGLPDRFGTPDVILPVIVQGRAAGFFVLWGYQHFHVKSDEMLNLRLASDIISRKIEMERLRLHNQHLVRSAAIQSELQALALRRYRETDRIAAILRTMRQGVQGEAAYLWHLAPEREFCTRYSIGPNGSLLQEKGLPVSEHLETACLKSASTQPRLLRVDSPEESDEFRAIAGPGYTTAVMVNVSPTVEENFTMVIAAATVEFNSSTLNLLAHQQPTLARLLRTPRIVSNPDTVKGLDTLNRIWEGFNLTGATTELLDASTRFFTSIPGISLARIATTESSGRYLVSRSLTTSDGMKPVIGRQGMMELSLMPLHRAALTSGKLMVASVANVGPMLTVDERMQVFSESIPSLAVMPFGNPTGVSGVITVGMTHADQALSAHTTALLRHVAQYLSLALNLSGRSLDQQSDWRRPDRATHEDLAFKSRMKSSLSGIFGSVELLKAKQEIDDPQMERYLGIIDKSARRMSEYLEPNFQEKSVS
ncbi:MAG: hypothetical protein WAU88_03345 [Candidatus Zixiibacteriota bacterium]